MRHGIDDGSLEVTSLKDWLYCGRVVWYRFCLPAIRPVTALMEAGRESHAAEEGREERRSLRAYGLCEGERFFDVWLYSERLGLRGRVDLVVAIPGRDAPGVEAVVVDYKDSEGRAGPHFRLQVAAYGVLVEEVWGVPVREGFVYHIPTRKAERVALTGGLRRKVVETIGAIHAAVDFERLPPPPSSRRRCVSCEFRRFCNDVV